MKKYKLILSVVLCFYLGQVMSQSSLVTLNGKTEPIFKYSVDYDASLFYYQTKKTSGRLVTRSVLLEDVFSYTDSMNVEQILYKPVSEDELSVEQMRSYVQGSSISRESYNPYWVMAGGFVVGTAGMFVSKNPVFSPLVPLAYCGGIALVKPSTDKLILDHPEYAENPDLLYGYQRSGRNKNLKYAVLGSAGGVIAGTIIGSLIGYYN